VILNTYGRVPVFHLANNAGCGEFGHSELESVVPLQDALNKAFMDKLVSMEFDSFRQRWATGLEPEKDPDTGQPTVSFRPGRDHLWFVADKETRFGEFSDYDLSKFNEVENALVMHIARVSGTPLHYMNLQSGEFPSGEAMRTAEAPFIAKVKDRQTAWGNVWEDAMAFALQIAGESEEVRLSAQWKEAAPYSDAERLAVAKQKVELGVPEEVVLLELGYSEKDIEEWMREKERRAQEMQQAMTERGSAQLGQESGEQEQGAGNEQRPAGLVGRYGDRGAA
jgi:uncharacterized protein (UPF0305 family)